MKVKFLTDLGISEETAQLIISESDSEMKSVREQVSELENQLKDANNTIQSYKDMDIDSIKQSVEDYKAKYEESENKRKDFEYRTKINGFVRTLNLVDDIYEDKLSSQIADKKLQFEDEKLIGGDDVVSGFKSKYPHAFKDNISESNTPIAKFTTPMNSKNVNITADDFRRMGIGERIKLKASNPELYKQFT